MPHPSSYSYITVLLTHNSLSLLSLSLSPPPYIHFFPCTFLERERKKYTQKSTNHQTDLGLCCCCMYNVTVVLCVYIYIYIYIWNLQVVFYKISLRVSAGCCITSGTAILTNVGQLLERRGKEFLGSKYKDPISSFSDLQEFSVSNPEVVLVT